MAHYYGTVKGGRGTASRLGHKTTGLVTTAQTWSHTVTTSLQYDPATGRDMLSVCVSADDGSAIRCLYTGFIDGKPELPVPEMNPVFSLQELEAAKQEIAGE